MLALCAGLCAAATAAASEPLPSRVDAVESGGAVRVAAELLVHPERDGDGRVRLGLLLSIAPGWHVYGADPGDVGLPTRLAWSAPGGSIETLPWPPAESFVDASIDSISRGYSNRVLLPSRARFTGEDWNARVDVELLACSDICVPAKFSLARDAALPVAAADAPRVRAAFAGQLLAETPPTPSGSGLLRVLLLAFAGGLLLNAMPCVLPVLAFKALALAEIGGRSRREALAHGGAYAGGILLSLLALAVCAIALRAAGSAVGWGFQFQEPLYVAALGALLVLFAAHLFGAFELRTGAGRLADVGAGAIGARRSFFDGLLTVALATPCTAPFLGTAVGFALARPAGTIVAVFLAIGAGLAAPMALAAVHGGLARRIPRPGPWMNELRVVLGFALLATALWLAWVVGRSDGVDAAIGLLGWLLVLAASACGLGALQRRDRAPGRVSVAVAGSALLVLGAGVVRISPAEAGAGLPARSWSPAAVEQTLAQGTPVFVYFTADWCLTCKLNERLVLRDERVAEVARARGIAVFEADWTRRDETIRAALERLGRSGVPAYVLYDPREPARPEVLPELLTVSRLTRAFEAAAPLPMVTGITEATPGSPMQPASAR